MLRGAGGVARPLIEWSWRAAHRAFAELPIYVATDDQRIVAEVERFGGRALLTSADCRNGTERCAEAAEILGDRIEVVINLQGDALLTPPTILQALHERLRGDATVEVATPAIRAADATLAHLLAEQEAGRVGGTTVVTNAAGDALYFSKHLLPHGAARAGCPVALHLGVYAYRREALRRYSAAPPAAAELAEGLEQLRFLDQGVRVAVVDCPPPDQLTAELNNPEDAAPIEAELARLGLD
ncbi:3-deoxy-manno-octulosonate cytidylyltransferase [Sphingomonas ginsengisoli (ex An et al. 2013)]|nr:3-deoxy-manno-octulosonate cytidylyltransferase [Sphingomonas ginsengisoli An et al. 2013]